MEEFKISDDAYEQIKDFSRSHLTEEQELLVDKLGNEVIEWAEYNDLENFEHLAKGGFGTVYKAKWKQGYIAYRLLGF